MTVHSIDAILDEIGMPMSEDGRDELADRLEALAMRLRTEEPQRGALVRSATGADYDRWMVAVEWVPSG